MKLKALNLSLGLVLLASMQAPAFAADFGYGGVKDMSYEAAAVAVPAPVPIPIYAAEYYFRADAGFGFGDVPGVSENGFQYGLDRNGGPLATPSSWLHNDLQNLTTFGVGVGTYFGNGFRADVTAESRSQGKVKFKGDYGYDGTAVINGVNEPITVRGSVNDETTLRGGIFMANGYYDFQRLAGYGLLPYIGGGIGVAWNELKRNNKTTESYCFTNPAVLPAVRVTCPNEFHDRGNRDVQDKTHSLTLAFAATTGVAYKISDNATIDMNYRFLYVGGTHVGLGFSGLSVGPDSDIEIDDTFEHQVRAGIRYDIN